MINNILKKFIIYSLLAHISIILLAFITTPANKKINKQFLVLGRHSSIPTHALFKSNRGLNQTDWFAKRVAQEQKIRDQRNARLKVQRARKAEQRHKTELARKATLAQKKPAAKKITPPKQTKLLAKNTPSKKTTPKKDEKPKGLEESSEETFNVVEEEIAEELQFDLRGEQDPQNIVYSQAITTAVIKLWHPPIGVPKATEESVRFYTYKNGKVKNFEIIEKSNILLYDLSIVKIAKRLDFGEELGDKIFIIKFRQ